MDLFTFVSEGFIFGIAAFALYIAIKAKSA